MHRKRSHVLKMSKASSSVTPTDFNLDETSFESKGPTENKRSVGHSLTRSAGQLKSFAKPYPNAADTHTPKDVFMSSMRTHHKHLCSCFFLVEFQSLIQ